MNTSIQSTKTTNQTIDNPKRRRSRSRWLGLAIAGAVSLLSVPAFAGCPAGFPIDCGNNECCDDAHPVCCLNLVGKCGAQQSDCDGSSTTSGGSTTGGGTGSNVCPNSQVCAAGQTCCDDNTCAPAGDSCCGDQTHGFVACSAGDTCCGFYCVSPGFFCCGTTHAQGCEDGQTCVNEECGSADTPSSATSSNHSGCQLGSGAIAGGSQAPSSSLPGPLSIVAILGAFAGLSIRHRRRARKAAGTK